MLNNEQPRLKRPREERWHRTANPRPKKRPPKSMRTSTRDVRRHRILIEASSNRSYGDDPKQTTKSTY
jgi:hypothetical protein